ncbi:hypothetical protein [Methylobacterium oxalidis]|uniref:hypothetical protein n=1 Tax=Methylobacterium oxalidis TaxID=944322 RepID=UPI003314B61E
MSSPEFEKFTRHFIQDLDIVAKSEEDMYAFVLGFIQGEERVRLRAFLDAVTQDSVSDMELQELWWASEAEVTFGESAHLRAMLKEARDRL